MTIPKLDDDVLRHIASFIPADVLEQIKHPVFEEVSMRNKYASVYITKRDKATKKLVADLSQPSVAVHVKKLSLSPWLVQPMTRSPRSRTENVITQIMTILDPHYSQKVADRRLKKRLRKDKTRVTAALGQMTRIQEYTIDWDGSPSFHHEFYHAFLVPPLEKWASHLMSLSICVPLSMVSSLARLRLPQLESFTYHFCTGNTPLEKIHDEHDGLVVFINNLKDSLQNLVLTSNLTSQHLDLSRIFRTLGSFPCLRRIALSIPFDGGHLSDPTAFSDFILRHSTSLKAISLTTSRCAVHFKPGDPEHINWIIHIIKELNSRSFPLLSTFQIALRPLKAPLGVLVDFLDRHSSTLSSLSFMDRSLTIREIESLFSASPYSSDNVRELRFKVEELSANLLSRIARGFPNLKSLALDCRDVVITNHRPDRALSFWENFRANIDAHSHHFADWPLEQLAIGMSDCDRTLLEETLRPFLPRIIVTPLEQ